MPMEMPKIQRCSAMECAYNSEGVCHAIAITVGDALHARCDTFFRRELKGGVRDMTGGVGACKMEECWFNKDLECSASSVNIGLQEGHAECMTFTR